MVIEKTQDHLAKPCCIADYEKLAHSNLPKPVCDYYKSGGCGEYTLQLNKDAFKRLRLRPRVLRDVSKRKISCQVLGLTLSAPIGVCPTAMQRMAHPLGECANARAVGQFGSVFILSTISTSSIEEVAAAAPDTYKWFQLYIYKDRNITVDLVSRAEKAGFKAIVLTVDAPIFGKRYADDRNKFALPQHLTLKNLPEAKTVNSVSDTSALNKYVSEVMDDSLSWDDVKWLKRLTKLPLIIKGILTAEDAILAVNIGVDGIIVSNHGGRQLDTVPASIEVLPKIVKAVAGRCDIFLDGGVSYGSDIFKALALGAKMVFVGRPAVWGLAVNGEAGVKHVLDLLGDEFKQTMALAGCSCIEDIDSDMVVHESYYSRL